MASLSSVKRARQSKRETQHWTEFSRARWENNEKSSASKSLISPRAWFSERRAESHQIKNRKETTKVYVPPQTRARETISVVLLFLKRANTILARLPLCLLLISVFCTVSLSHHAVLVFVGPGRVAKYSELPPTRQSRTLFSIKVFMVFRGISRVFIAFSYFSRVLGIECLDGKWRRNWVQITIPGFSKVQLTFVDRFARRNCLIKHSGVDLCK